MPKRDRATGEPHLAGSKKKKEKMQDHTTNQGKGKGAVRREGSGTTGDRSTKEDEEGQEEKTLLNADGREEKKRKKKRQKKAQDEDDYEGPVEEDSSSSGSINGSQEGGDDNSGDESSDSDDEIKLDGALSRREDEEEDSDGGGESGGDEAGGDADEQATVDINLDFCDPNERFFHGIRALVAHSYLQDATGAGLSALVDLAVAQGAVGTVLSTDGEDDAVFGFVTALPLRHLAKDNQCAQAIIRYLLEKAAKGGRGSEMEAVLGESATGKVGLLVSERMINCPMQAVPKLHEALADDIAWAVENEISEEHREKFRFDKFVVVAPCDDANGGRPVAGSGPPMLSDFYFSRFDDEVLLQEADFFFPMGSAAPSGAGGAGGGSASGAGSGGGGGQNRYVVGVMPSSKHKECTDGIAQMVA